jgi:DNA-directed RNA polymerase subunit RPC12/RpoP
MRGALAICKIHSTIALRMKTTCAFCKTNFMLAKSGAGRCPACGRRTCAKPRETAKFWIATALFLGTCIFAITALTKAGRKTEQLTISLSSVAEKDGEYVVRGHIRNFSENAYPVPDLVFVMKGLSGTRLNETTRLPPNGLIEPRSDIEFERRLDIVPGAQRISVSFAEE